MNKTSTTEEYRQSFISLISKLSDIELGAESFFNNCEKSVWNGYDAASANTDLQQLLANLQSLETFARESGLLSISGPSKDQSPQQRSLADRGKETQAAIDTFFQEQQRLMANIRTAQ